MTDLSRTKSDIADKNHEFSGADAVDMTGVVSNLAQLKNLIASGNNGITTILNFSQTNLLSMNSTQVTNLANDRSGKNLNLAKIMEMSGRVGKINEELNGLLNYMDSLNISNTLAYFNSIREAERFKKQNVEILDTRKSQITTNLNYITANTNALKSTFTNARGIYNTIGNLNNTMMTITALQAKR